MTEYSIVSAEGDDPSAPILEILDGTARELGKPFDGVDIVLHALDAKGGFLGGITWDEIQGWLFVKYLAVAPQARGLGVGSALLARVEGLAKEQGLAGVYLDTFDFQAPDYYAKLGYKEIGRLPATNGHPARMYFAKTCET